MALKDDVTYQDSNRCKDAEEGEERPERDAAVHRTAASSGKKL